MTVITEDFVTKLFSHLETGDSSRFFEQVADNVQWQVMGTHPLAGIYHSKENFLNATFRRLNKILNEGVILKVTNILVDKHSAAIEMESLSTAKNGARFNNKYCWVVVFNDKQQIKSVTAYLDSALVQKTIDENE